MLQEHARASLLPSLPPSLPGVSPLTPVQQVREWRHEGHASLLRARAPSSDPRPVGGGG